MSWVPPLTALTLLPCAIVLGRNCGWTPGAASLLLMLIPICMASLIAQPWGLLTTSVFAAASSLAEGFLGGAPAANDQVLGPAFPVVAAGVLVLLRPLLGQFTADMQTIAVPAIELPNLATGSPPDNELVTTGVTNLPLEVPVPAASVAELLDQTETSSSARESTGNNPEQVHTEDDDPQLLLTLQEVGWRVATDYDLATLYQTVRHTTQRILRCQRCCVMLWNPQDSTLTDALQFTDQGIAPTRWANRGMLGWVAKNRQLLVRTDVDNDPALQYLQRRDESHFDAIAPLSAGGELLGVLTLEGVNGSTPQFRRMLQLLANVSALAIKNARLFQRIAEMARHDGLTGLLNHASFQERLRELVDKAQCHNLPLSVIMSDVDRFKSINDAHGHPIGDHVLREVGRIWKTVVPTNALAARYGGEEFICAVPGMELQQASDLAEELRSTIEMLPLSFERGVLNVTASFGVAQLGMPARNATELVRLADEALYQSKRGGRNRVTLIPVSLHSHNHEIVTKS